MSTQGGKPPEGTKQKATKRPMPLDRDANGKRIGGPGNNRRKAEGSRAGVDVRPNSVKELPPFDVNGWTKPFKLEPTEDNYIAFLHELAATARVVHSCKKADLPINHAYWRKKQDPGFHQAWEEALQLGYKTLEDEAIRRARDGVDAPVYYKGVKIATLKEYSDSLLMFMLKAVDRPRFGDVKPESDKDKDNGNGPPVILYRDDDAV